jgi:hypothetical protein
MMAPANRALDNASSPAGRAARFDRGGFR